MRLLLITSTFPPLIGGAETYALTVADGLSLRGHDVTVITDGCNTGAVPPAQVAALDAAHGFRVARLTDYRDLLDREGTIPWEVLAFGLLPELEKHLQAAGPIDVVLTNSLDAAPLGKIASIACGVPWAATFHEQAPEATAMGQARLSFVYDVLRPDLVIAGSEFYEARAKAFGCGARIVHIVHGVDTDTFRPHDAPLEDRRAHGIPPDALVLLCAGRLTPRKGIPDLLGATAVLVGRWPTLFLVVVGTVNSSDRAYADTLQENVQFLGLDDRVMFNESAQPTDMPSLFNAADIVVQPSHAEGLGLAVLEAMSSERPVVTTDIPATRQITKGKDVLAVCAPGAVTELAAVVDALLGAPTRRAALAVAGRAHVLEHFSRRAMLRSMETALLNLIAPDGVAIR